MVFIFCPCILYRFSVTSLARCGGNYWAPGVDSRDSADDTISDSDQIRLKKITNHISPGNSPDKKNHIITPLYNKIDLTVYKPMCYIY